MIRHEFSVGVGVAGLAMGCLWSDSAHGNLLEYEVGLGVGSTDNIFRTPEDGQDETIRAVNTRLRVLESNRRLDADIYADLTYNEYQDGSYDNHVAGLANADLRFKIVPDRFAWIVRESFGQASLEPFEAQTPENLENVNYFTTGPEFEAHLGADLNLTLIGRYSSTRYEVSNFDDERLLAGMSLGRELEGRGVISLNALSERVEFRDPDFGSDYDRLSAFMRYELESQRTRVGIQAGYTETRDRGEVDGSPLFEASVFRQITDRSTLSLQGGVYSSDVGAALRQGNIFGAETGTSPHPISSSDLFETRYVTLGWRIAGLKTEASLSASYVKDAYAEQDPLDRTRWFYQLRVGRSLTARLSAEMRVALIGNEYEFDGQRDDETQLALQLSWNLTNRLYLELIGESFRRESSRPATEFDENRAFLRLTWRDRSNRRSATALPGP